MKPLIPKLVAANHKNTLKLPQMHKCFQLSPSFIFFNTVRQAKYRNVIFTK